jgi:GNAT superfamily N-acetyltransferase
MKLYRPVEKLPQADTSLVIEQIGPDYSEFFSDIIVRSFEWPEALKPLIAVPIGKPGWLHYLAYRNHIPVACAALFIREEIASLAFAATLPEARGLGAQSALINRRINDAAEAGCRWIISETAEEKPEKPVTSYRNLRKYGFRVAYLRPNYIFVNEAG